MRLKTLIWTYIGNDPLWLEDFNEHRIEDERNINERYEDKWDLLKLMMSDKVITPTQAEYYWQMPFGGDGPSFDDFAWVETKK